MVAAFVAVVAAAADGLLLEAAAGAAVADAGVAVAGAAGAAGAAGVLCLAGLVLGVWALTDPMLATKCVAANSAVSIRL